MKWEPDMIEIRPTSYDRWIVTVIVTIMLWAGIWGWAAWMLSDQDLCQTVQPCCAAYLAGQEPSDGCEWWNQNGGLVACCREES